jgi:hypothetical protein
MNQHTMVRARRNTIMRDPIENLCDFLSGSLGEHAPESPRSAQQRLMVAILFVNSLNLTFPWVDCPSEFEYLNGYAQI